MFDANAPNVSYQPSLAQRLPRRLAGQLALAASFSLLAGRAGAACLPPGVDAATAAPAPSAAATPHVPAVSVFLDVSGSMAGYVARPRTTPPAGPGEPRVFHDVVLSLPQLGAAIADRTALFAFGTTIRPLPAAELSRAADPRFYADQDSRIQDALARMDALPPGEVSLLITDLFLSGADVFGDSAAIRNPLAHILDSGRSLALIGIRSGFFGTVYDIPGAKPYKDATERPFYILGCGPGAALAAFISRLDVELLAPLPPPRDGQSRWHATLFTHTPLRPGLVPLTLTPRDKAAAAPSIAPELPAGVSRIRFSGPAGSAAAPVSLETLANGPALLPDRFDVVEQVWAEPPGSDGRACPAHWIEIKSLARLTQLVTNPGDGAPMLVLGGAAMARVTPGLTFVLQARLVTAGLSDSPVQTAWVRAWNLEARDAEDFVASRPKLFRTLNLREIVAMLEGLVREQLTPQPVAEALLAFQVAGR